MRTFKKPQYAIAVRNNLCAFVAHVNDIPAFINIDGLAYNLSVPINYLLKNGRNTFRLTATPHPTGPRYLDEISECFASIIVKDFTDNADQFVDISTTGFPAGTSNDKIKLPLMTISGQFEAELPFPDFYWTKAPKLDDDKERSIRLAQQFYKSFHEAFVMKDRQKLYSWITPREKELCSAFYDDYDAEFAKTKADFEETMNNADYVLQPLDFLQFRPVFYGNGRLITFMNDRHEHAIFFLNDVAFTRRQYPLFLCLDAEGQMIPIR